MLELSSFQLETICRFRAHIGVALNVTPDHLDRHHTFEKYAAAKARLFETQQPGDFAVLNADDPVMRALCRRSPRRTPVWFSSTRAVTPGASLRDGDSSGSIGEPLMPAPRDSPSRACTTWRTRWRRPRHAALAGASLRADRGGGAHVPASSIASNSCATLGGVAFYNDSKATNVDATLKAIAAFDGGLWVILGGKDKNSDYTVLRAAAARKSARRAADRRGGGKDSRSDCGRGAARWIRGTLDAAVRDAYAAAQPGDTVLLAPACASFDQFDNYEHRGRVFKRLVAQLEPKN